MNSAVEKFTAKPKIEPSTVLNHDTPSSYNPDLKRSDPHVHPSEEDVEKAKVEDRANQLTRIFIILSVFITVIVLLVGLYVGSTIRTAENRLNHFINSQSKVAQELTAEVAELRVAASKISGKNPKIAVSSINNNNENK